MKPHILQAISGILTAVFLLLSFGGCSFHGTGDPPSSSDSETDTTESSSEAPRPTTSAYSIQRIDGKCYIVFDDISAYERPDYGDDICVNPITSLDFSSAKEFKEKVTQGMLEEWEKSIVASQFSGDENGILICDFDQLYVPILPEGLEIVGMIWTGESYSYYFEGEGELRGEIHCDSKDAYDRFYQNHYVNFYDRILKEEQLSERDAVQITYTINQNQITKKSVRYALHGENKIFEVDEDYSSLQDTLPSNLDVYCTEGEHSYLLVLRGYTELPSEEWLLSFGMKLYSDSDSSSDLGSDSD